MTYQPITVWRRLEKDGWEHNHIEDGHAKNWIPTAKFPHQKENWKGAKWQSAHCYLINGKVCNKPPVLLRVTEWIRSFLTRGLT